jgi:hypothetical protein
MTELNPIFDDEADITVDDLQKIASIPSEILACSNPFPYQVFPSPFQELITETNKALNYPVDYTGTAILTAVSTAIGKSAKIRVKNEWFEFPAFYVALVGNSGAAKSHPIDMCFKVFRDMDRTVAHDLESSFKAFEEYMNLTKAEKAKTSKVDKPVVVKTILDNFTPEILHQRLADNIRGCCVVSDELATFLDGMNNYSKGDQSSTYLSFWSNKPTSIDRVSKPIPLFISNPFLNILGSLQPRVLGRLFPPNKTDSGFLQRFLFSYIHNASKAPITDNEINSSVLANYSEWIRNYIRDNPVTLDPVSGYPQPKIYYWTDDAKAFFYQWQRTNTDNVNLYKNTLLAEVLNKFDIHFIRIALIMQIMEDYKTNHVSLKAVKASALLCEYFITNANHILEIIDKPALSEMLPDDKQNFYADLPEIFTTAEALELGNAFGFKETAIKSFIARRDVFNRISHGKYAKKQ